MLDCFETVNKCDLGAGNIGLKDINKLFIYKFNMQPLFFNHSEYSS